MRRCINWMPATVRNCRTAPRESIDDAGDGPTARAARPCGGGLRGFHRAVAVPAAGLACTATGAAVVSGGGHVLPVAVAGLDGAVDGARADRRWLGLVPASATAGGAAALAVAGAAVAAAAAGHASALSVGGAGRHGRRGAASPG